MICNNFVMGIVPQNTAFFDIETTGFSRLSCTIYMIGVMKLEEDGEAKPTLFFAEKPEEEAQCISNFFEWLEKNNIKRLITFNGASFDIPFVSARIMKKGLAFSFDGYEHLDIYKEIAPLKNVLGLENCKQKSIEAFLGISREDEMDGGQLINVYKSYVRTPSEAKKHLLYIHNYEDVLGMLGLLPILSYVDTFSECRSVEKITSSVKHYDHSDMGMDMADNGASSVVFEMKLERNVPVPIEYVHTDYDWKLCIEGNELSLDVPLYDGRLRYYYTDYKEYFYLPDEGFAVHKSVGVAVDKSSRIPATKSTCYTLVDYSEHIMARYFRHCMEIMV